MPEQPETQILADFGQRLRQVRLSRGLNLHELARLTGISAPALSLIETGKRDARLSTLSRLAAALRLSLPELLGAQQERPSPTQTGEAYDLGDYS